jgi:predicted O-methyltransferase YrrM
MQALPDGIQGIRNVDGFLSLDEAAALYDHATKAGDGVLEIGTYCGRSTIAIAAGRKATGGSPVYAVDHGHGSDEHQGAIPSEGTWPKALRNFERFGVRNHVIPVMLDSVRARVELDHLTWSFVFIDGAHDRLSVMTDASLWLPRVRPGGWMAFHDCSEAGMENVVPAVEAVRTLMKLDHVGQAGSIAFFEVHPERWT